MHTNETKRKISEKLKGVPKSTEHKAKMKNLKTINNGFSTKRVQLNDLDEWLKNGWVIGVLKFKCFNCEKMYSKHILS